MSQAVGQAGSAEPEVPAGGAAASPPGLDEYDIAAGFGFLG
jgi:hypothetical protein